MTDEKIGEEIMFARVGLSLPCMVPVLPGTPDTDPPIEERTETCNVDAWWIMGRASTCHYHLVQLFGDERVAEMVEDLGWPGEIPNKTERQPWEQQRRYEQNRAVLPEWHPLYRP